MFGEMSFKLHIQVTLLKNLRKTPLKSLRDMLNLVMRYNH